MNSATQMASSKDGHPSIKNKILHGSILVAFHLSLWYTKKDLAKRIGLFISAGALSGAFGGLIAFGVNSMKHWLDRTWLRRYPQTVDRRRSPHGSPRLLGTSRRWTR
jgi:hypothetical protein